jgi:O-antigen/teichoic acid export membrane protein
MARFRTVARNVSANYLGVGVRTLLFLLLTPFIIHYLGTAGYAVWILAHTLAFYLRFLDFGLYKAMVKYLAGFVAASRHQESNTLIANALGGFILAGFAALGLSIAIAEFLVPLFKQLPPELIPQFQTAIILFGLDLLISFPASVSNGIFEGYQRYDILNYIGSGLLIVQGLGTVVLLLLGHGIVSLAVLEICISILTLVINLWIIQRLFPEIRWAVKFFHPASRGRMRSYRLWSSLNEILVEGASHLDRLLIPFFLSVALLTPYTIICTLAAMLLVMIEPLTNVLFPMSSEQDAKCDHQGLQSSLLLATKGALAVTLPAAIVLASMGDSLIDLWIGQGYVQAPAGLLPLLLVNFLLTVFFLPASTMLAGIGKLRGIFIFSALETVLAITLVLLSVRQYELIGLAASYGIANFIIGFSCLVPFACRHLRVPVAGYLIEGLLRPLVPALPAAAAAWFLTGSWPVDNWPLLLAQAALIIIVYVSGFFFLSLSRTDRAVILDRLRQLRAAVPGRPKNRFAD